MRSLISQGYCLIRGVFGGDELVGLRQAADRVAHESGSACVRKLGGRSRVFRDLASSGCLSELLPGFIPVRSILFDKTAQENWPVAWHQDLTICVREMCDVAGYGPWSVKDGVHHVQPPVKVLKQMFTLRVHLDFTPSTNGALRVIPNSHSLGRLSAEEIGNEVEKAEVVCECDAGDVLAMSPLLLHASRRSESPSRRRVIHIEYAPRGVLDSPLEWCEE